MTCHVLIIIHMFLIRFVYCTNDFLFIQKKKKDRMRGSIQGREIPDAPTLEEFECLLGESPTNYPRGEGIENMESELHSAAIDTEVYEKDNCRVVIVEANETLKNKCFEV